MTLPPDVPPTVQAVELAASDGPARVLPPDVVVDARPVPVTEDDAGRPAGTTGAITLASGLPLSLKEPSFGDDPDPSAVPPAPESAPPANGLDNQRIYAIVREVAVAHSGDAAYSAVSADAEFSTPGHPDAGSRHLGLGFGLVLFTQESGQLGAVLELWRARTPAGFAEALGPSARSVIEVTGGPDAQSRLAPVDGMPLWADSWLARFRAGGTAAECQAAQNQHAIEAQFRPAMALAVHLGLDTERTLAMVYDSVVARGLGSGLRWVVQTCAPLRTRTQREHALGVLACPSVADFQTAAGLAPTGTLDALSLAALCAAASREGYLPRPDAGEQGRRLVLAAAGPARERLERLWVSTVLADSPVATA
jgi:hypothetical protein